MNKNRIPWWPFALLGLVALAALTAAPLLRSPAPLPPSPSAPPPPITPSPHPLTSPSPTPTIPPPTPDWGDLPTVTPTPAHSGSPTQTPNPYLYLETPLLSTTLSAEEAQEQHRQMFQEVERRAQVLYDNPSYMIAGEIANPLFKRAFPDAHMYMVWTSSDILPEPWSRQRYVTMVSLRDKDYKMPGDFNKLMFDAGYELTDENRDLLAQALIIAALPPEVILLPVTCEPGREIYEPIRGYLPFMYEIRCRGNMFFGVTLKPVDEVVVKLDEFDSQFRGGYLQGRDEYGDRLFGGDFSTDEVTPGEE